jgi:hypothetical protein
MMSDLVERAARAVYEAQGGVNWERRYEEDKQDYRNLASAAVAIALDEAAKVVTEHYEALSTGHRLMVANMAAAIRKLGEE